LAHYSTFILDSQIYSNTAPYGGGVAGDQGAAALFNTDVRWNVATVKGGGLWVDDVGMLLAESTVRDNSALAGGGIYVSGASLELYESTLSHNTAITGGGLYIESLATAVNSTISGNEAGVGGGSFLKSAQDSTLYLLYSTVADNAATGDGGGVYHQGGVVVADSSIVAGNSANGSVLDTSADCAAVGPGVSAAYGLFGDGTGCPDASGPANLTVTPADVFADVLGPLADNGGPLTASGDPASTHALLPNSPALDHISAESSRCRIWVASDQRGVLRPQGENCDIGAYESNYYALTVTLAGSGSGLVSSTPAGIACGTNCTESWVDGTVVTLTASADPGSTFSGWSGDVSEISNPVTVTITADTQVTATFTLEPVDTGHKVYLPLISRNGP
jgi:hypothetical protein